MDTSEEDAKDTKQRVLHSLFNGAGLREAFVEARIGRLGIETEIHFQVNKPDVMRALCFLQASEGFLFPAQADINECEFITPTPSSCTPSSILDIVFSAAAI